MNAAFDLAAADSERALEVKAAILVTVAERVAAELHSMAYEREPVTGAMLAHDRAVEGQVDRFRQRYDSVDVTLLDTSDPDKWELVGGCASERFEVREVRHNIDDEIDGHSINDEFAEWHVYDTWDGVVASEHVDETDAMEYCDLRNLDQGRDDLYGFPFAHRWGYSIEEREIERFVAHGFVVWRFDGEPIAGIDGGGYSFDDAHWRPMWLAMMEGCVIDTDGGPRVLAK